MKKKALALMIGFLLVGFNLFAADGDLIVNGNIGIGTANAGAKLEVYGGGDILLKDDGNDPGDIVFQNSAGTEYGRMFALPAGLHLRANSARWADIFIRNSDGNVGVGTYSPANVLAVLQGSTSDPIADSWTTYACDRTTKEIIRVLPNQSGVLDQLLGIELYEWKRKPLVSDEEIKGPFDKDITAPELERRRQQLSAAKSQMPKFQATRVGMMIDDPNIPDGILAVDGAGKKGIDLIGYIGWLHATIKELAKRVQELEKR
jgi:hypothetical protein